MDRGELTFRLSEYEIGSLTDDELGPIVEAINLLSREAEPRAVDLTLDDFRIFAGSPGMTQHRYAVHDATGTVAALGGGRYPSDGTNPGLLLTTIRVLPAFRRKGIATMILSRLVDLAAELGRSRIQGFFFDTVPAGRQFARAVGAEERLDFHENVIRVADLDRDLMRSWSEIGAERAPGYTIELFEGPVPESRLSDIAHLYHVLERDMPMSQDFEPREWSADRVAQEQEHYLGGADSIAALAVHEDTHTAVGMSQMIRRKSDPTTWSVTVTMVDPDHRGKSIGKWVKGTVNIAALESWEGGVYEETGNAFTNEAMLAINHAMGFEHEFTITDCSVSIEDARGYLSSRR